MMGVLIHVLLVCSIMHVRYSNGNPTGKKRSPIILVPGAAGSQLEARLDRDTVPHDFCPKKTDHWSNIWLNINSLLSNDRYCLEDNIKLQWDPLQKKMKTAPGVFIRPTDFGNTTGIEWLDPTSKVFGQYMYPLVDTLCNTYGYVRGKSIRGAPYDFRYAPGSKVASIFFKKLTHLIKKTYRDNGNTKVVLLAHSLGAPYMLHFLRGKPKMWKDKYIKSLVTIGGAFAGAVRVIGHYIHGLSFGIPSQFGLQTYMRDIQRTFTTGSYLLPDKHVVNEDEVLVEATNITYTVKDYDRLFKDIGYPLASDILRSVPPAWNPTTPGVKIYCYYGINVPTTDKLTYNTSDLSDEPVEHYGNGDGTVNYWSLQSCKKLPDVTVREFDGVSHNGIFANEELIKELDNIL